MHCTHDTRMRLVFCTILVMLAVECDAQQLHTSHKHLKTLHIDTNSGGSSSSNRAAATSIIELSPVCCTHTSHVVPSKHVIPALSQATCVTHAPAWAVGPVHPLPTGWSRPRWMTSASLLASVRGWRRRPAWLRTCSGTRWTCRQSWPTHGRARVRGGGRAARARGGGGRRTWIMQQ